ncbi:DUF6531 domain-containing protein [Sorangium sp. So ce448]|uniref:DUF6531 domain-containing protein n=1 Tax=Sorangium sp. So ce448 TaxID=3133314 RepID=UPI003F632DD4
MLASTWLDIVIGIDLHFELVPPPMLPVPFPHPFVGLVLDPIGLAAGLAISNAIGMAGGGSFKGPVLINLMPANTTGTEAKNLFLLPHFIIPPGTVWAPMMRVPKPAIIPGKAPSLELPIPPPGDAVMITGSKTVHAMGANLCRLGDIALSCSDPIRLPTSAVLAIPKGLPVLVGGPPAVDWMAAAFGLIKCKWLASRLHRLVSRIKNARLRNLLHHAVCFFTGHPVDVATGRVMTESRDFDLPGPLPLVFERRYMSSWAHRDSPLGHGWSHPLDQAIWLEPGCVVYRAEDGREIEFDTFDLPDHAMRPGEEVFEPINRLTLRSLGHFHWEIETADGLVHQLEPIPGDTDRTLARLVRKRTRNGHEITLHYDAHARLSWVRDSGGRIVRFEHDESGRLTLVSLPHPTQLGWVPHTRYVYSGEGDLVEVIDPLGNATRYEYEGHLLVRETDRTGLSFYFGYDGNGPGAYCIRTWGDGGIYDHEIDYDKVGRVTYVTNSLDATTTYEMNVAGAVVKVIDACGGETRYEYDDNLWKTADIDPLGNSTTYEYDVRGNCTKLTGPDGATVQVQYDGRNLPVQAIDPCGSIWRWLYDEAGQMIERRNPLGDATRFEHKGGQLSAIITPAGGRTSIEYDQEKNLGWIRLPNRAERVFEHDRRGRPVSRRDDCGNVQRRHYDACGRPTTTEEPDGNVRRLAYDAEGNLVETQDHHRHVRLRYTGRHKLARREEAGELVIFRYDTEEHLVEIVNPAGEKHSMERDACGRISAEHGFDGQSRRYEHDRRGYVIAAHRADGSRTVVDRDKAGRTRAIRYDDGTSESFRYREDGLLIEAENETAVVRFLRDAFGRVLREAQGEHWIESQYDISGRRTAFVSSLGAREAIDRDVMGDPASVSVGAGQDRWSVRFTRNSAGLEIERRMAMGLVASVLRDSLGRPVQSLLTQPGRRLGHKHYRWEPDLRLAAIEVEGGGADRFSYDACGRLAMTQRPDGRVEHRALDASGNLYRQVDRADRVYAPGGALLQANGIRYIRDVNGNLIERVLQDGSCWRYRYNGAGLLREVERPDGQKITFAYDALGRRLKKRDGDKETAWIWDGDVPLHEVSTGKENVTWIFAPETFMPIGKIQNDRLFWIANDHLGSPTAVYDDRGEVAWEGSFDSYGRAEIARDDTACPWRWPGQYEDDETGLHYNRFRYYDPSAGQYISRDPVGLLGGMNLFAYPLNPTRLSDPLGLMPWAWNSDSGMGHHLIPRGKAASIGLDHLATEYDTPTFFPNPYTPGDHEFIHRAQRPHVGKLQGPWNGTADELFEAAGKGLDDVAHLTGDLRIPSTGEVLASGVTPREALDRLKEWHEQQMKGQGGCS